MLKTLGPDWDKSTPLYVQLANNLRALILSGEITSGDSLPSERTLAEITGTSRVTIRKAILRLIDEGLLLRKHGAGTFIAPAIEQSGEEISGFSQDAKERGEKPSSIWLVRAMASPTEEEAKQLRLAKTENVIRLGRVRVSNGEPLAIEHAVVPAKFLPDPERVTESLYQALKQEGYSPAKGLQRIKASLATPTEAGLLSIRENSEILRIERNSYLKDGTPVEFTRSAYRGDKYVFVTKLHR
ncbi:MAG TPA: GntR family transcriptional regulator [Hellea balneolensis]|uniref:GntR family transcriptional regulator n=1 Tax=Hellea balneolensis TaxID=287478 RepID=A0A7C5LS76_9PROT|nr:GntR family transcriptional regulator [Hellea balneolensis]